MSPQCPVCKNKETVLLATKGNAAFIRCSRCEAVFKPVDSLDTQTVQELQDNIYRNARSRAQMRMTHLMAKERLEILNRYAKGLRLLEVGCATGEFIEQAKAEGYEAQGVDASKAFADFAREKGLDVRNGHIEDCLSEDEKFDVVAAFHMIEHAVDPVAFLKVVYRHLDDEGLLFIVCPNLASFSSRLLGFWNPIFQQPDHLYFFNRNSLLAAAENAGFRPVHGYSREYPFSLFYSLRGTLYTYYKHKQQKSIQANGLTNETEKEPASGTTPPLRKVINLAYKHGPYYLGCFLYPIMKLYALLIESKSRGHEIGVLLKKI